MFDPDAWYTRKNIADELKVCENTVINWEKNHGLPANKIGHVVRARGLKLNEWIELMAAAAAQKAADVVPK
jgi:hypothetical protein